MGIQISASVYDVVRTAYGQSRFPAPGGKARVQNGASVVTCTDVVFELIAHGELENWTSLSHSFTKEGVLQLLG